MAVDEYTCSEKKSSKPRKVCANGHNIDTQRLPTLVVFMLEMLKLSKTLKPSRDDFND